MNFQHDFEPRDDNDDPQSHRHVDIILRFQSKIEILSSIPNPIAKVIMFQ